MTVFLALIGVAIAAGLFYVGTALWEGMKHLDTNALQAQVSSGTPIEISQVRALEARLTAAVQAAQGREQKKDDACRTYLAALYNKITDLGGAYSTLMKAYKDATSGGDASPGTVSVQDFSQDYAALMESIRTVQSLGMGQIADFGVPPGFPVPPVVTTLPDPSAFPDIDAGAAAGNSDDGAAAGSGTDDGAAAGEQVGSIIGAAQAAAAADAANAQAAGDQSAAVAIPPGAIIDTHPETGAVTVTLPAGTVIVQADPQNNDPQNNDQQQNDQQQGDPQNSDQQQGDQNEQDTAPGSDGEQSGG